MFYQTFPSPQGKRNVIVINKHSTAELPHELPKNLRLMEIRKNQAELRLARIIK